MRCNIPWRCDNVLQQQRCAAQPVLKEVALCCKEKSAEAISSCSWSCACLYATAFDERQRLAEPDGVDARLRLFRLRGGDRLRRSALSEGRRQRADCFAASR